MLFLLTILILKVLNEQQTALPYLTTDIAQKRLPYNDSHTNYLDFRFETKYR